MFLSFDRRAAEIWKSVGITEPIILASNSPRRAEILRAAGCPFEVFDPRVQEESYGFWDDGELLQRKAVQKAESTALKYTERNILAADTVVRLDARVFGKPRNAEEAISILHKLSGKTHEVWTAICYLPAGEGLNHTGMSRSEVQFRSLSAEEINAYVRTGEPLDKAGAYGIQGIGGLWVQSISGCYFNIVGFPLGLFWDLLKKIKG